MLYNQKELPEIFYLKHFNDSDKDFIKYDEGILDKTLSPNIYKNDMMNSFLKNLEPLVAILFDQMNVVKNWKNYMVDKYDYRHK